MTKRAVEGDASRPARSLVGRGDLLRALAAPRRSQHETIDTLSLDASSEWFGFVSTESEPVDAWSGEGEKVTTGPQPAAGEPTNPNRLLPLALPKLRTVVSQARREAPASFDETPPPRAEPLGPEDRVAHRSESTIVPEDIVPRPRLLPALRRALSTPRAVALDVQRLVAHMAAGHPLRVLPRRATARWASSCVVVVDFAQRLFPFREDLHRLVEMLRRQCGDDSLSPRILFHGPDGPWSDWREHQLAMPSVVPSTHRWSTLPPRTRVVIASDLGVYGDQSARDAWREFVARLIHAQAEVTVLAPVAHGAFGRDLPSRVRTVRWSLDSTLRPERRHNEGEIGDPNDLDSTAPLRSLLAMAAMTDRVDPPLLRALRRIVPTAADNVALEGWAWSHPHYESGIVLSVLDEHRDEHRRRFEELPSSLREACCKAICEHHAHLRPILRAEEAIGLGARLPVGCAPEGLREAETYIDRLIATLHEARSEAEPRHWIGAAQSLSLRADERMVERFGERLHRLLDAVLQASERLGQRASAPAWVDEWRLSPRLTHGRDRLVWLVEDLHSGQVQLQPAPPRPGQFALGEPLVATGLGVRVEVGDDKPRYIESLSGATSVVSLADDRMVRLRTMRDELRVAVVDRPRGAAGWTRADAGIEVESAPFRGRVARFRSWEGTVRATWDEQLRRSNLLGHSYAVRTVPAERHADQVSSEFVIDPYGLSAELRLSTNHGTATQRFRCIEPGSFLMGSPESERERDNDEGPQHAVTITRGFWLCDTACTQGLWESVMGSNPSDFKGADRPVENVSWRDVQEFLAKLSKLLPGCVADLPTEAEWEYACRAGTGGPFSMGETVTTEQANYHGDYPYAGGPKGEFRGSTVPVRSFAPNDWGMYEMHGNVWEWCRDGMRPYTSNPEEDPVGPEGREDPRVVRGGSWGSSAGWLRSADRDAYDPGNRNQSLGFRFCLRSPEPSQAGLAEPASVARGAGPRPPEGAEAQVDFSKPEAGGVGSSRRTKRKPE